MIMMIVTICCGFTDLAPAQLSIILFTLRTSRQLDGHYIDPLRRGKKKKKTDLIAAVQPGRGVY